MTDDTEQSGCAPPTGCYSLCQLSPWFQGNDYVVERVSQICVSKKMRTSEEMQNCSSGLRTLVAFGETFIRDDAASKHSQVRVFTWEESHGCAAGGFVSRVSPVHVSQFSPWNGLTGDITPHMHFQRQVGILLRPLMTGTQPHNVWTYLPPFECPTSNRSSYFNFLLYGTH